MAPICLLLLFATVVGQPLYGVFEKGKIQNPSNTPNDKYPSPALKALFFMQSAVDYTQIQPFGGQQHQRPGDKSPELPPGLSKLFPSFTLPELSGDQSKHPTKERVDEKLDFPQYSQDKSLPILGKPFGEHAGTLMSKSEEDSRELPGMFARSQSGIHPPRKIRRNRDRNHHRKVKQKHAGLLSPTDIKAKDGDDKIQPEVTTKTEPSFKTKTIANQHFKFLFEGSSSQLGGTDSRVGVTENDKILSSPQEKDTSKKRSKPGLALGAGEEHRIKRSATLAGADAPPAKTFYYRMPEEHSGTLAMSRDHRKSQPDSLVHSLEIEDTEVAPDPVGTSSGLAVQRRASADLDQEDGTKQEDAEVDKASDVDTAKDESEEVEVQEENHQKTADVSAVSTSLSDNTTVNETLARQMFRSPMLVDYGSRVKPQDVIPPTESDAEEDVLGETKEETDPLWTEGKVAQDDISLEAEDPEEEDPPKLPEAEAEVQKEPVEEEIIESGIELPIVPVEPKEDVSPEVADEDNSPEPAAESVPDPEPQPEPEGPVSEAEGESESKNEDEPIYNSGQSGLYAEPQPEWEEAKKIWGPWWEIHVYGTGLAFAVLSIYSLISVIRLWRKKNLLSQGYFIALNSIMFFMGTFRAMYFLVDGYNSNSTFNIAGHYFLYSIGFPCLTSAFSILLLAFLQTLKMQILSPKIQRTRVFVGIIAAHFILSILTDIIVGYLSSAVIMMFVCQIATVLWGLLLFFGYIYVFRKLYKAAKWRQNEMMRLSLAKFKLDGISPLTKAPRLTLNMAVKVTLGTAIFGLILAVLQTYGLLGVYSIFSKDIPEAWTWFGFKTGMRLTELAMCITMSYVATQPFRYNQGGKSGEQPQHQSSSCFSGFIYMAPCRRIFECDSVSLHDDDLSWNDLPITRETGQMDADGAHVISEEATPMTANGRAAQAAAAAVVHSQNEKESSTGSKRSSKIAARPASLLVSDNGFIRFREDGEMGGSPVLLSTDDELENISGDNMIRNPFYRDLLRRQEKERAVGRATFVNSDGITLQDEFGLAENLQDPELVPPPRPAYPVKSSYRSYPNTGTNTPGTPRSFCSTDLEYAASEISYRPPSSIHLRDSIENALNIPGFTLRTPDILDSPLNAAYLRTRRGSLFGTRVGARPMGTGSMSDLESLRHYGPGSRYGDSEDTMDVQNERAASPDSMYSYTLSNLTRAPLVRSYSDSIGKASQLDISGPNSPERRFYKDRLRASMLRNLPENANQFQNLLKNINEMCNVYNKLSPDDREGDE